jgi:leader peptidase (prepilin peptidase)/N-methyltransferase
MAKIVIRIAIILCFYIIGAYATTDIVRLLKGAQLSVWDKYCYCPICNERIRLIDQIPIIAYLIGKGRCRKCNSKIPLSDLWLEIIVFSVLTIYAIASDFSYSSLLFGIIFYEILKIICFLICGTREKSFVKNYVYSLFINIVIFALLAFLYLIEYLV